VLQEFSGKIFTGRPIEKMNTWRDDIWRDDTWRDDIWRDDRKHT
jgi:hypothetical protein